MKKFISAISLIFLTSSYVIAKPTKYFDTSKRERTVSKIIWKVIDKNENIQSACNKEAKKHNANAIKYQVEACAIWFRKKDTCIIITKPLVNIDTIGHEVMHCFFGDWH